MLEERFWVFKKGSFLLQLTAVFSEMRSSSMFRSSDENEDTFVAVRKCVG